ncbi:MAG: hypothetical protein ACYSWQ_01130 [Planctomycetota bacterium]|jgi:hypothetical protein
MNRHFNRLLRRISFNVIVVAVALWSACAAFAAEDDWPCEINIPEGKIVIYQPQLETFKADKLIARAAVSVTQAGQTEPVFGAVWFAARVSTDRNTRMVALLDVEVAKAKFPGADPAKIQKLSGILETEMPKWDLTISLDRLLTMLDLVEKEKAAAEDLRAAPPKIIFVTHPAVLILIDGEPLLHNVENSDLMRVANTPFFILFDRSTMTYYLKGGDAWLKAPDIMGPWKTEPVPPASVLSVAQRDFEQSGQGGAQSQQGSMPQIIVSTEPAELIQTNGEPKYSIISGTDLLYVSNTENDLFMEISSQRYFVLLAGRWYVTSTLKGPWSYVPSDKLPADFAKIPVGSAKGHVLAHVAGTQEAEEAVLDTYIPQTAAINRSETVVVVKYDGQPKFVKIEGTNMYYAVNTSYSVIRVGEKYYCCNEAVWFAADSPSGPWVVCVSVPQEIYTVPPSCPVYNVKYVYVYDYTPTVVYVGYTPGYTGCYVYGTTVVYGTGYVYTSYSTTVVYYPRPVTYGYRPVYRPYRGWGYAAGFAAGAWVGSRHRHGWWGPHGYRDIDASRTVTTPRGTWSSDLDVDRSFGEVDIERDVSFDPNDNIYDRGGDRHDRPYEPRQEHRDRYDGQYGDRDVARTQEGRRDTAQKSGTTQRENNVFADKNGDVYRKTDSGWQQRDQSGWSNADKSRSDKGSRPSTTQSSFDRSRSGLESHSQARDRGSSRTSTYQSSSRTRSSGSRGGRTGGRRR